VQRAQRATGRSSADTVPIATARDYDTKLQANGKVTKFVADPNASHEWLSVAPTEVTAWFTSH
jgi:hypothetical protein